MYFKQPFPCYNEAMADENSRLVYSTDREIQRDGRNAGKAASVNLPRARQKVTVRLERKGRGGKTVTIIEGLRMSEKEREFLLRNLKSSLGTGGTAKDTSLEIQGDHREMIMAELESMGHKPKRSGF
jgi:translation initiation factor 1